jgi:hypothetical protein
MSCKMGMLTGWVNYVSNLLNGVSNANFVTDRAMSEVIRIGSIS